MRITSWNVNSINARLAVVERYVTEQAPDILFMQELKTLDFPEEPFKKLGYECHTVTQKTYNGVAILSKTPLRLLKTKVPGYESDEQARFIEAEIEAESGGLRLINIYLPNGNPIDTEKFDYKLEWMAHLKAYLQQLRVQSVPFLIGGDFNIIPEDKDCHDPKAWKDDALFHMKSRKIYRSMLNLGLTDALRVRNTAAMQYTFWDYQAGAWPQNKGIRIDHFLLSPEIADRLQGCAIHKTPRGWEKPSDHTPIEITLQK
ncbi:MAG: exodeoxyribonuclease III [Alphaproteobacteria bacterium]